LIYSVRTKNGIKRVKGRTWGRFGYHLASDGIVTIVHLSTGFAIARSIVAKNAESFVRCIQQFSEWDDIVVDEPDENSKVIIDIPKMLNDRMVEASAVHNVKLTTGNCTE
jgi:hypothetical protein